jgi:hypothetical protein
VGVELSQRMIRKKELKRETIMPLIFFVSLTSTCLSLLCFITDVNIPSLKLSLPVASIVGKSALILGAEKLHRLKLGFLATMLASRKTSTGFRLKKESRICNLYLRYQARIKNFLLNYHLPGQESTIKFIRNILQTTITKHLYSKKARTE